MSEADQQHQRIVDATGLVCPAPVNALAAAIDQVELGTDVVLTATDPTSRVDVPVWCRLRRQELRHVEEIDGIFSYHVRRRR